MRLKVLTLSAVASVALFMSACGEPAANTNATKNTNATNTNTTTSNANSGSTNANSGSTNANSGSTNSNAKADNTKMDNSKPANTNAKADNTKADNTKHEANANSNAKPAPSTNEIR